VKRTDAQEKQKFNSCPFERNYKRLKAILKDTRQRQFVWIKQMASNDGLFYISHSRSESADAFDLVNLHKPDSKRHGRSFNMLTLFWKFCQKQSEVWRFCNRKIFGSS